MRRASADDRGADRRRIFQVSPAQRFHDSEVCCDQSGGEEFRRDRPGELSLGCGPLRRDPPDSGRTYDRQRLRRAERVVALNFSMSATAAKLEAARVTKDELTELAEWERK